MPEIGIERLGSGDAKKHAAEHQHQVGAAREQVVQAKCRIDGPKHRWVLCDAPEPQQCEDREPDRHDRPQQPPDARRAALLGDEEYDQNHQSQRQHIPIQVRGNDVQPLQRRQDRDGGGESAVSLHQRRAKQAHKYDEAVAPMPSAQKRHQRKNAAFAFIVHTKGKADIFHRGDDDQRPNDQRQSANNRLRSGMRTCGFEHDLQRVEGARPDIAIHHAKRGQAQCGQAVRRNMRRGPHRLGGHVSPHAFQSPERLEVDTGSPRQRLPDFQAE
jgi:hypothetical protein